MIAKWFQMDGTMQMISDRGAPGEFLHASITRTKKGKDAKFLLRTYAIERGVAVERKFPPDTFTLCFLRGCAHCPLPVAVLNAGARYNDMGSKAGVDREMQQRRLAATKAT